MGINTLVKTSGNADKVACADMPFCSEAKDGLVRQLPKFERFLEVAALTNAEEINYSNIASDVMMSRGSITEWYGILYDTMIGFSVPPYTKTKKRKAVETERFYYFDVGLVRFFSRSRRSC